MIPLLDKQFLKKLDSNWSKELYAKVISLNNNEQPIESIEGKVIGGSITIDGTSSIRRTCNLTLSTEKVNINNFYWGLTNKIKIFIGLKNDIDKRYDPIIWFPQGLYIITNFDVSYELKNYKIIIQGKDKMCLLNGDVSGNFPMPVDLSIEEYYDENNHKQEIQQTIPYIIREMIHYYGNEPFHNIILKDIEDKGLELLEYRGSSDIYILFNEEATQSQIIFNGNTEVYLYNTTVSLKISSPDIFYYSLSPQANNILATKVSLKISNDQNSQQYNPDLYYYVIKLGYGDVAGYRVTDLTWPGKDGLQVNQGDTITNVLDKIIQTFGDYEYFYDVEGHFVFQKKMNYLNTSWNNIIKVDPDEKYVESSKVVSQYLYDFNNNSLIQSISHKPDFANIKNDFSIWGKKKIIDGSNVDSKANDIHMRFAIHEKPTKYVDFEGHEWVSQAIEEDIEYTKKPVPEALGDNWWDLQDWAEYYKLRVGKYPESSIGIYCTSGGDLIDLNNIIGVSTDEQVAEGYKNIFRSSKVIEGSIGKWFSDWDTVPIYIFDVIVNQETQEETLGYVGHRTNCTHSYSYFLQAQNNNIKSYIYKPIIPQREKTGRVVDWRELIYRMANDYMLHNHDDDFSVVLARNNPQYPNGRTGYEQYYTDILGFWRDLYNPESADTNTYFVAEKLSAEEADFFGWNKLILQDISSLRFWFDFLDATDGALSKYSVAAIGSRPKVINDDNIKTITYNEVPTVIYITQAEYTKLLESNSLMDGYTYIKMPETYNQYFIISAQSRSCQSELDNMLYTYIYAKENIEITAVPIYYLEPNRKITINDIYSKIYGDYIVDRISFQLTHKNMMRLTVSKAPERLY